MRFKELNYINFKKKITDRFFFFFYHANKRVKGLLIYNI
jgi:hypothetical protein